MTRLNHRDWEQISAFLRELYAQDNPTHLPNVLLRGLAKLIPCEHASYNEIDSRTNAVVFALYPWIEEVVRSAPAFEAHLAEHPQLRHFRSSADRGAYQMTDFLSRRQWRELALYREFYRHAETDNQLAMLLSEQGAPCEIGIGINRKRRDFSERDRTVLELLRPHLIQIRQNAAARAEAERNVQLLDATLESLQVAAVLLDTERRILWLNPSGVQLLEKFFPGAMRQPTRLPDALDRWVQLQCRALETNAALGISLGSFEVWRQQSCLTVRCYNQNGSGVRLLFSEEVLATPGPASRRHGLTSREAEVLGWISEGKTNEAIAAILKISPRTVHKHVERVLTKLGVENRTAAARLHLESGRRQHV